MVQYTHNTTRLINHDEITFSVLEEYLDGFRRDRRLVTMNDIFDAIAVPHNSVRLGNLAVDGRNARLERVSLQREKNDPQLTWSNKKRAHEMKKKRKTTHNIRSNDPGIRWRQSRVSPG